MIGPSIRITCIMVTAIHPELSFITFNLDICLTYWAVNIIDNGMTWLFTYIRVFNRASASLQILGAKQEIGSAFGKLTPYPEWILSAITIHNYFIWSALRDFGEINAIDKITG